jgi:uncharacterized membrane protein YdjX (TVP38/TMEM64 family)
MAASAGTLIAGYLDHSVFVPALNLRALHGYKEKAWYQKAARLFLRFPFLVLVLTAFTPIPFFPFKFLCFSAHYPLWGYLAALFTGRFPRYLVLAWFGRVIQIPDWLLFAVFAVVLAVGGAKIGPKVNRFLRESRAGAELAPSTSAPEKANAA